MPDPDSDAVFTSLRTIRRHLTVAFLAVGQLCRKFGALPPVERLCSFATDALTGIRDEVTGIEERLLRRERRRQDLPDEFPDHPPDL